MLPFLIITVLNREKLTQSQAIHCQPASNQNLWLRASHCSWETVNTHTERSGKVRSTIWQARKCAHVKCMKEQTLKTFQTWAVFREGSGTDVIKKHRWKAVVGKRNWEDTSLMILYSPWGSVIVSAIFCSVWFSYIFMMNSLFIWTCLTVLLHFPQNDLSPVQILPLFVSTTTPRLVKYTCKWSRAFPIPLYARGKGNQNQLWNFSLATPEKIYFFLFTPKTKEWYLSFWSFRQ